MVKSRMYSNGKNNTRNFKDDESPLDYTTKYNTRGTINEKDVTKLRNTGYGDPIANIGDSHSVAEHFKARKDWLVPKYIANMKQYTQKDISADNLLRAIETY